MLLNGWVLFRFPTFDWLGLGNYARAGTRDWFLSKLGIMISWECGLQQYLAVATLAVNRLTAIVFSHRHEQIWTRRTEVVVIMMHWLLPAIVTIPQIWLDFGYHIDNVTGEASLALWLDHEAQISGFCYYDMYFSQIYFTGLLIFNMTINFTTMVIYLVIFWHIKKHLNTVHTGGQSQIQSSRTDTKLAFFGFVMFLVMAALGIYAVLMTVMPAGDMEAYNRNVMIWTSVTDVFSWANPWLIIMFSAQVRDHMLSVVWSKPQTINQNRSVRSSQRRQPQQQTSQV